MGTKWGVLDNNGVLIAPFEYDRIWGFEDGAAIVCNGKLIDKNSMKKSPFPYKLADESHYIVGKYGFIDVSGKEIASPKYLFADEFFNGFAKVYIEKGNGYIDMKGREFFNDTTAKNQ